ncbi:hypothetical protein CTAYLR_001483 [Chrysophaeum taylorii]|uniref:Calmodulin n=1 Tax=Chrysophaeum taylorii TaxID=2483200 RepID=A0AAD7UAM4_9STRA|nr:hypothetical protein CTAYLR_001483 [Chrysophaeum taylorii]
MMGVSTHAPAIGAPPAMPQVDTHISRAELKYRNMSDAVRKRRWVSVASRLDNLPRKEDSSSDVAQIACGEEVSVKLDSFEAQIQAACTYIDERFGNGDGEISQEELERVMRVMRRDHAERVQRERGRALVRRLVVLLERRELTLDDLVREFDRSQDGKLSRMEVRTAIDRLTDADHKLFFDTTATADYNLPTCLSAKKHALDMKRRDRKDAEMLRSREVDAAAETKAAAYVETTASVQNMKGHLSFSDTDLTDLIRFLDPDADGDLSVHELRAGVEAALRPQSSDANQRVEIIVFGLMETFQEEMKSSGLRISEVFRSMDEDGSGSISVAELRATLDRICGPSAKERARRKREQDIEGRKIAETRRVSALAKARARRILRAEAAGAPRALSRLDELLKKQDLRLIDLFSSRAGFDESGDGRLDATELRAALAASGLHLDRGEVDALVAFIDDSGDGTIDAIELSTALRQHRRDREVARNDAPRRRQRRGNPAAKSSEPPVGPGTTSTLDGLEFDNAWLKSLDAFIARHTGPQPSTILQKYDVPDGERNADPLVNKRAFVPPMTTTCLPQTCQPLPPPPPMRGMLWKQPREKRVLGAMWQEREFVLEEKTLRYYAHGTLKGEVVLATQRISSLGLVDGKRYCFEIAGEVRLAAKTEDEMSKWIDALRMVTQVDERETEAMSRVAAMLRSTRDVASATAATMDQQGEHMDAINRDLEELSANIHKADKNLDKLERWRFWGGKSDGVKAARHETKVEDVSPQTIAAHEPRASTGLEVDDLLDSLDDAARALGDKCRDHNAKLHTMAHNMDVATTGLDKVNQRAKFNENYLR